MDKTEMDKTTSDFVILYSTFADHASARKVADALLEARLIACANIFAPMTSVYRWQGKTEQTEEVGVFFKTRRALADAAIACARPLHPYEQPCFLTLPVGGTPDYLNWIAGETVTPG